MDAIASGPVKAKWFNPRTGEATAIGEFPNTGEKDFLHPNPGEQIDWVLVLDDMGEYYPSLGVAATRTTVRVLFL